MEKKKSWFKKQSGNRYNDIIIGIPVVLVTFAIAGGVYSLKAYLALQGYFLKATQYTVFVPDQASFHYERYMNAVFLYIFISLIIGVLLSGLVSRVIAVK